MTIPCSKARCKAVAVFVPKIMIPAIGHVPGEHSPIGIIVDLPLCTRCMANFKVKEVTAQPPFQASINGSLRAAGRADADFAKAFVRSLALASSEYADFKSIRRPPPPAETKH